MSLRTRVRDLERRLGVPAPGPVAGPHLVTVYVGPIRDEQGELIGVRINDQVIERGADETLPAFQKRFPARAGQV
jgi:hypothetical protein